MIDIIVAMDKNRLIGTNKTENHIPWHNKEDFKHFRSYTLNKNIVMGKVTYQAIGKPLPKRHTIVMDFNPIENLPEGVDYHCDLEALINEYKQKGEDLIICGGASIYRAALPFADRLVISRIPGDYEGDTWFPDFSEYGYTLESSEAKETFTLEIYRRQDNA